MKVSLDTNVLVSAFATRGLCADILHVVLAEHQLLIGDAVFAEMRLILRQKVRLAPATIAEVDAMFRRQGLIVVNAPPFTIRMRDADDLAILAEAVAGGADVLVTGDRDLLDIAAKAPLPIVTPRGFWELLRSHPEAK